jgi:hypothetical protein
LTPPRVARFHSNTLHCSAPNTSAAWRRNVITVYNSRHNEPDPEMAAVSGQPMYSDIRPVRDSALAEAGAVPTSAANAYLDQVTVATM